MLLAMGRKEEWDAFQKRNEQFLSSVDGLTNLAHSIFEAIPGGAASKDPKASALVLAMVRLCWEDFHEVMLLAANGFGTGAWKIVRGLYERTVTAAYLSQNPTEAERFVDFGTLQRRSLINHISDNFPDQAAKLFDPDQRKVLDEECRELEKEFQETLCEPCKKTRRMPSWSKLGMPFGAHQNSPSSAQIELATIRAVAVARKPLGGRALSSTPSGVRVGRST